MHPWMSNVVKYKPDNLVEGRRFDLIVFPIRIAQTRLYATCSKISNIQVLPHAIQFPGIMRCYPITTKTIDSQTSNKHRYYYESHKFGVRKWLTYYTIINFPLGPLLHCILLSIAPPRNPFFIEIFILYLRNRSER